MTRRHLSRRTFLRGVGVTLALPILGAMIPALQTQIKAAKIHAKDVRFLAALLDAVIAVLALIGTLSEWATEILLMEISFFHFHGTGRPPQELQVQSVRPGSVFCLQLQS